MTSSSQHTVPQSAAAKIPLRDVIFFSVGVFFFWTALYIYIPILSVYAQSLGASLSMVGLIVAAYAIPQFLFRIPLGILFDSLRRRKWLITVGILITSAGALGLAVGSNTWAVFGARILTGVGAATWVAFTVYFVAYYPASEAPRAIGIINSVQGAALVIVHLRRRIGCPTVWLRWCLLRRGYPGPGGTGGPLDGQGTSDRAREVDLAGQSLGCVQVLAAAHRLLDGSARPVRQLGRLVWLCPRLRSPHWSD